MEKSELISVIIPVYNVEKYLRECVDSVLNQTYQNLEIILVDDGSTDDSGKICDYYVESNGKIQVIHKTNGGASSARNIGLKAATGKYIYFLDSDDWMEREALERIFKYTIEEQADFTYIDAYAVEEETGAITTKFYSHKKKYATGKGFEVMKELLQNKEFHVAPWLMFFKKSFLEQSGITFEEGIIYEDMIFTYQVFCEAKRVAYIPEYLYYRRYRENSVMTAKVSNKNFLSMERVYYCIQEYSEKLSEETKSIPYIAKCAYNAINVYRKLEEKDKKNNREKFKRLKKDILMNNAYGDMALRLFCYNRILWACYKMLMKLRKIICRKVQQAE